MAADTLTIIPFAHLRLNHRAWNYVGVRTANISLNVGLTILLVAGMGMGVKGVFLASLAASAASLALLFPVFAENLRPVFGKLLFRDQLRFGAPLSRRGSPPWWCR